MFSSFNNIVVYILRIVCPPLRQNPKSKSFLFLIDYSIFISAYPVSLVYDDILRALDVALWRMEAEDAIKLI